jgi:hypothetical protein
MGEAQPKLIHAPSPAGGTPRLMVDVVLPIGSKATASIVLVVPVPKPLPKPSPMAQMTAVMDIRMPGAMIEPSRKARAHDAASSLDRANVFFPIRRAFFQ